MKQTKFKLTSPIFIFFLLVPHFKPLYFDQVPILDMIWNIWRIFSAGIIFVIYLSKRKIETSLIVFLLLKGWLLLATLYNGDHASLYTYTIRTASEVSVFLICLYMSEKLANLLKAMLPLGELLIYGNLITVLLFPNGLFKTDLYWENWLLGYRNSFFPFFIAFVAVSVLYLWHVRQSIRPILLIAATYATLIIVDSATSIFSLSVFFILLWITLRFGAKILNAAVLTLCNVAVFFLLVIFRILDVFSFIIVEILDRNTTLTGRTLLWDDIYYVIGDRPLFGYGVMNAEQMTELLNRSWAVHAHNLVLQFLLEGGVLALVLFVIFNALFIQQLYCYRTFKSAQLISVVIFVYYIACLTEVYTFPGIYVVYALAFAIDRIAMQEKGRLLRRKKVKFITT